MKNLAIADAMGSFLAKIGQTVAKCLPNAGKRDSKICQCLSNVGQIWSNLGKVS